jgi:uncharacterized protein (DUF2267 family)
MTVPQDYQNASRDFDRFMDDLLEISMLPTHHSAYAVLRAVLHVFRGHLTVAQALRFADALPAVLRAIFVEGWQPRDDPPPFPHPEILLAELRAYRPDHTLVGETSVGDVARALRRHVPAGDLKRALNALPPQAQRYWLD